MKAGEGFQDVVFKFAQLMIEEEQYPECFRETTLHMIFKDGKGKRHNLSANRFIHSKFWLPRLVKGLVVIEGLKEPLVNVHPPQHVTCHMSNVMCHVSCVMCHVSHVTCHMSHFFLQSGEAYWWRVCYQRSLPRLGMIKTEKILFFIGEK